MKYIILTLLLTSCAVRPLYRLRKAEYCEQKPYDTICEGYEEEPSYPQGVKGAYEY